MAASQNPNGLRVVLPNAGGGFAVQGSEIFAGTIQNDNIAAGTIGSAQVNANLIQTITLQIPNTSVVTAYDLGIQVLAAPGTGKSIVCVGGFLRYTYGVHAFTSGGAIYLQYDSTTHAGGVTAFATVPATGLTTTASVDSWFAPAGTSIVVPQNKGIFFANDTADFALAGGSTSTVFVTLHYFIQ
jgi:hypothetical protein